jgi:hypothetical protein
MTTKTVIICRKCGWQSSAMDDEKLRNLGVPWYCTFCGSPVTNYISYEPRIGMKISEELQKELNTYNFKIKNIY